MPYIACMAGLYNYTLCRQDCTTVLFSCADRCKLTGVSLCNQTLGDTTNQCNSNFKVT